MELVLSSSDFKSVSSKNHKVDSFTPGGLLNSNYQSIVKMSHRSSSENSLYKLKQRIKISGFQVASSAEVLLKLTIFTALLLSVFN